MQTQTNKDYSPGMERWKRILCGLIFTLLIQLCCMAAKPLKAYAWHIRVYNAGSSDYMSQIHFENGRSTQIRIRNGSFSFTNAQNNGQQSGDQTPSVSDMCPIYNISGTLTQGSTGQHNGNDAYTIRGQDNYYITMRIYSHTWKTNQVAPTCTTAGSSVDQCTRCGATQNSRTIPPTGHKWISIAPAVCEYPGQMRCSVCGATKTVDPPGHSYYGPMNDSDLMSSEFTSIWNQNEDKRDYISQSDGHVETLTAQGGRYHYYICTICGDLDRKTEHTYGAWTKTTEEGEETRACTVCGYKQTRKTPVQKPIVTLVVEKKVVGVPQTDTDSYSITLSLSGLQADTEYKKQTGTGDSLSDNGTFTSDSDGNATVSITLKDKEKFAIPDLPSGATVTAEESEGSGDYVPYFKAYASGSGGTPSHAKDGKFGEALTSDAIALNEAGGLDNRELRLEFTNKYPFSIEVYARERQTNVDSGTRRYSAYARLDDGSLSGVQILSVDRDGLSSEDLKENLKYDGPWTGPQSMVWEKEEQKYIADNAWHTGNPFLVISYVDESGAVKEKTFYDSMNENSKEDVNNYCLYSKYEYKCLQPGDSEPETVKAELGGKTDYTGQKVQLYFTFGNIHDFRPTYEGTAQIKGTGGYSKCKDCDYRLPYSAFSYDNSSGIKHVHDYSISAPVDDDGNLIDYGRDTPYSEYHVSVCQICGDTITEPHSWWPCSIEETPFRSFYTKDRYHARRCDTCNYSYPEPHYFETTKEPTCTEEGTEKCSACIDIRPIPALGHDFQKESTTGPTCTEDGYDTYKCTRCGETEQRENGQKALGHDFVLDHAEKEPTCTEEGTDVYKCTRCGVTEERKTDALGHDLSVLQHDDTDHWYDCSRGDLEKQNVEAHVSTGAWKVTKKATSKEEGEETSVCKVCGAKMVRATKPVGEEDYTLGRTDDGEWLIKNEPLHTFRFTKEDMQTKKTIAGALFNLSGMSDYGTRVSQNAESDENGVVEFPNLESGTYTLKETGTPDGYISQANGDISFTVTISVNGDVGLSQDGETGENPYTAGNGKSGWIIYNEPYHTFEFLKIGAYDGSAVKGATFTLSGTGIYGGAYEKSATSDKRGRVSFSGLEPGTYALTETEAPAGYLIDPTSYIVTIDQLGGVTVPGMEKREGSDYYTLVEQQSAEGQVVITKRWEDNDSSQRAIPDIELKGPDAEVGGRDPGIPHDDPTFPDDDG